MERRVSSKDSRTVWSRGKVGDNIKNSPIAIGKNARNKRKGSPLITLSNPQSFVQKLIAPTQNHTTKSFGLTRNCATK